MYFLILLISSINAYTTSAEVKDHWHEEVAKLRQGVKFHKLPKYTPLVENSPLKVFVNMEAPEILI